jgi:hypothetical protein
MVSDVFDKEENRKNFIHDVLKTLTKREENVLRLYFGIGVEKRVTLEGIGQDYDLTVRTIKKYKNKGIRKMMHPQRSRLLISHIDKDLIERCEKNGNNSKLMDEFMMKLLYPPKEIVEKWVIIQTHIKSKEVLEEYIEPPE